MTTETGSLNWIVQLVLRHLATRHPSFPLALAVQDVLYERHVTLTEGAFQQVLAKVHAEREAKKGEQAPPRAGQQDVTPIARREFLRMLAERASRGIATYGTTLQTFNGRDAIRDAKEECLDLWQYLCQIEMERDAAASLARWPVSPACAGCRCATGG